MSARILAVLAVAAGLAGGCASRHVETAPAGTATSGAGNATVSQVSYFAAGVVEPKPADVAAPPPAPTAADKRAAAAAAARNNKRKPSAPVAPTPPAPRPAASTAPRYEYVVELDRGGFQTVVAPRDLGLRVNDRVRVQGDSVEPLAN